MKKFLSLALALIMTLSLVTISAGAAEYKDFTDKDEIQYEEAVAVLNKLGIITGYSEGDFRPEGELTRGAAAKIIVSLLIGPEAAEALPTTGNPYPDVPAGNVFAGYIGFCKTSGIISGYGDGTFRPNGTLTGYAFSKMLLGALGYKDEFEGLSGEGWTMNVANLGNKAGLFKRIDFKGGETVNRETACLLALNTLKATMVEYTGGMNITTDAGSMVVNPTRTYVTSNQDYAKNIDNRKAYEAGNANDNHYTVEFGEEHFRDLRMERERSNSDDFGRPSNEWSYKKVTIGTYPIEADFTYTTQVIHCVESTTAASKTRALGLSGYDVEGPKESTRDRDTKVWVNGYELPGGISDVSEIADYTDNGTLVEVYVSDEDADFITDVVVVKTQLMEVKRVGSDYVSLDLYDDGSDNKGKEVFGYNAIAIDKKVNDVEVEDDCYAQLKEMKAGDIVAVVPVAPGHADESNYDVAKVYAPETATGNLSRVETYGKIGEQNAIGVTVGGTAYKIALWNKDLVDIDGEVVNLTKKDVTVYLDEYGNVLMAKDVGGTKDWMVIKNYRQGLVNGVIVTYVNGWDISGNEVTLNIGGGKVADDAKAAFQPGDLVRYESDSSSNTAEWALSMTNAKGVFNVATLRDKNVSDTVESNKYTISASNTTIKLDGFDDAAKLSGNKDLATIDNGIKFIYVSIDKDGEVDGIEFVNGVKAATNAEIKGDKSPAHGVKNAQACVSLKDNAVKDNSAVKAVVIKQESTDASVSNLLYISKYLGSATRHTSGTNNSDSIVYSYEVVMMGPNGQLVDDDMTIYSYKNLKIGQFARYSKATAPEGMDGVNNDNFYDLRGYGVDSGTSSAADTFGRSAAVVKATVVESLKQNKYLLRLADYDETTAARSITSPKIASIYSSDVELDLGDDQAKNLVNARGVAWVDLRDVKEKIDDIDTLKDIVMGTATTTATPVRATLLFNDNPDSDDFRRVYLIIIHGTTTAQAGSGDVNPSVDGAFEAQTAKVGDTVTVTLNAGYSYDASKNVNISNVVVDGNKITFKVDKLPATVGVSKDEVKYTLTLKDNLTDAVVSINGVGRETGTSKTTLEGTIMEYEIPENATVFITDSDISISGSQIGGDANKTQITMNGINNVMSFTMVEDITIDGAPTTAKYTIHVMDGISVKGFAKNDGTAVTTVEKVSDTEYRVSSADAVQKITVEYASGGAQNAVVTSDGKFDIAYWNRVVGSAGQFKTTEKDVIQLGAPVSADIYIHPAVLINFDDNNGDVTAPDVMFNGDTVSASWESFLVAPNASYPIGGPNDGFDGLIVGTYTQGANPTDPEASATAIGGTLEVGTTDMQLWGAYRIHLADKSDKAITSTSNKEVGDGEYITYTTTLERQSKGSKVLVDVAERKNRYSLADDDTITVDHTTGVLTAATEITLAGSSTIEISVKSPLSGNWVAIATEPSETTAWIVPNTEVLAKHASTEMKVEATGTGTAPTGVNTAAGAGYEMLFTVNDVASTLDVVGP